MSDDIAIKVENLTKTYRLYDSPQDRLKEALHPLRKKYHRDFHALNGVSFEVKKGETVGIIGRNGSGKSTLLKIITGVLTPSGGTIAVQGKISAILELTAGFSPLMTGVENIYFNGALNGYTKDEIDTKLDSILAFAEIGDFVHQPVKVYSSGMSARLGFAVAIHVDPDILIIDEALSVGDMAFQNKCYRRIESFVKEGKTVLFVSHSLPAVRLFCQKALWLHSGNMQGFDATESVTDEYEKFANSGADPICQAGNSSRLNFSASVYRDKGERAKDTHVWIDDIRIMNSRNKETLSFITGERLKLQIGVTNGYDAPLPVSMGVAFLSARNGMEICRINNIRDDKPLDISCGDNIIELTIPALPLLTGEYFLSFYLAKSNIAELFHKVENTHRIEVTTPFATCGWRRYDGLVAINHSWLTSAAES
jgi:ABC-type polysaccharide/polyol phosphate transport system ATPase subunit